MADTANLWHGQRSGHSPGKEVNMHPRAMNVVIDRKRYSTETATLIADNAYWDGHNFERHGRNTFLYRTPRGGYFALHLTQWERERDSLEPLTLDEAISLYEDLADTDAVEFAEAFPSVEVQEA